MYLDLIQWDDFLNWILYDKKLSGNKSALYSLKARFKYLKEYFAGRVLTRESFIAFIAHLKNKGNANSSINKYISLVKNIGKFAKYSDLADFTYYRENKKDVEILSWEEISSLAMIELPYKKSKSGITPAEQNLRMRCLILLIGSVGCRISEALNLEWQDLHSEYVVFRETKNGDDRYCPIRKELYNDLLRLPKASKTVFQIQDDGGVNLDLKKRAQKAGIQKNVYCHALRHSLITNLLKDGASLPMVAKLVGHNDWGSTSRYTHLILTDVENMLYTHSGLWKEGMTFDLLKERIRQFIGQTVDLNKFKINIEEKNNSLKFEVTLEPILLSSQDG